MEPNHLSHLPDLYIELNYMIKFAHVRLMTTKKMYLEPWKNAFLGLERFQNNPGDPMRYVYPAMIDVAIEEGQLDVDEILDEFESCIFAWVETQIE